MGAVFGSCVAARADVEAVRSPGSVTKDTSPYHNMVCIYQSYRSPVPYNTYIML